MNNLKEKIQRTKHPLLNLFFTAGFPTVDSMPRILKHLQDSNVDMVEIGMPYSDPLADGATIQHSSKIALSNGMSIDVMFDQLDHSRKDGVHLPIIIMGYFNQVLQYGIESFLIKCKSVGVDALILPDLPMKVYKKSYKQLFEKHKVGISFLIGPDTSNERIDMADELSTHFIYMVSKASITGTSEQINQTQTDYFNRIQKLNLKKPKLIGFGIHDHLTFFNACQYAEGAIVGSAFIRHLEDHGDSENSIHQFITKLKKG